MTLAETARIFKLGFRIILGFLVLVLVFRIGVGVFQSLSKAKVTPTPTPIQGVPPTNFGKLSLPSLESLPLPADATPLFSQDLITATLPSVPAKAKVYPILRPSTGFLAQDRARDIARRFGFESEAQVLPGGEYHWEKENRSLKINRDTLNLFYQYDYKKDPSVFVPGAFFSEKTAINTATDILRSKGLLKNLGEGKPRAQLLKFSEGELRAASNLSETAAIRVDFPHPPLEDFAVVTPDPDTALVSITISGRPEGERQIIRLNFVYWEIQEDKGSEYPLKTATQAWGEFRTTRNYLVNLRLENQDPTLPYVPLDVEGFIAREVYLAYLNTPEYQEHLRPVWVFKGKAEITGGRGGEWVGYVPAIASQWVK